MTTLPQPATLTPTVLQTYGGNSWDSGYTVGMDATGTHVCVLGVYNSTSLSFGSNIHLPNPGPEGGYFVAKVDPADRGAFLWAVHHVAAEIYNVVADSDGNCYLADRGWGFPASVARLNAATGALDWVASITSAGAAGPGAASVALWGNSIFFAGYTPTTASLSISSNSPGATSITGAATAGGFYIAQLDRSTGAGQALRTFSLGGPSDIAFRLAVGAGKVVVSSVLEAGVTLNLGGGSSLSHTTGGASKPFFAWFDASNIHNPGAGILAASDLTLQSFSMVVDPTTGDIFHAGLKGYGRGVIVRVSTSTGAVSSQVFQTWVNDVCVDGLGSVYATFQTPNFIGGVGDVVLAKISASDLNDVQAVLSTTAGSALAYGVAAVGSSPIILSGMISGQVSFSGLPGAYTAQGPNDMFFAIIPVSPLCLCWGRTQISRRVSDTLAV